MAFVAASFGRGVSVRLLSYLAICLVCETAAYTQADPSSLRSAFGPPSRSSESPSTEVFTIRAGFELTAHYSTDHELCKLEIEPGKAGKAEIDQVLEKAVPFSARGKRWSRIQEMDGLSGFENTYYEKVIVSKDLFTTASLNQKPGAEILFKNKTCGWKPGQDVFDKPSPSLHSFNKR